MALSVKPRLGSLVKYQIPQHLREDKEQLTKFLQYYYNWCEQSGQPGEFLNNLIYYKDVDHASHFFADLVWGYYTKVFPEFASADKTVLVKNVREFFRAKGTFPSYQFVMQAIFNEEVSVEWLSNKVFRASANEFNRDCLISIDIGPEDTQEEGFVACLGMTLTQPFTRAKGKIERVTNHIFNKRKIQVINLNDKTVRGRFLPFIQVFSKTRDTTSEKTGTCSPALTEIEIVSPGALYVSGLQVKTYGGTGEGVSAHISSVTTGSVDEVIIINKGKNYEIGDKIISKDRSSGGSGFEAVVEKIDGVDAVLTLNQVVDGTSIISGGYNYTVGDILYVPASALDQDTTVGFVQFEVTSVTSDAAIKGFEIERNTDIAYNVCKPVIHNHDTNALVNVSLVAEIAKKETVVGNEYYKSGQVKKVGFTNPSGGPYNTPTTNVSMGFNGFGASAACVVSAGAITTVDLIQGGFNYVNPIITVSGDGHGAILEPTVVGGVITGITIAKGGKGYTTAPTIIIKESDAIGPTSAGGAQLDSTIDGDGKIVNLDLTSVTVNGRSYKKGGSGYRDPVIIIEHPSGNGFSADVTINKLTGAVNTIIVTSTGTGYKNPAPKIRIVERPKLNTESIPSCICKPLFDNAALNKGQINGLSIVNKGSIKKINQTKNVALIGGTGTGCYVDINISPIGGVNVVNGGKFFHFNYGSDIEPDVVVNVDGGIGSGFDAVVAVDPSGVVVGYKIISGGKNYSEKTKFRFGSEKVIPPVGVEVFVGDSFFAGNNRFVVSVQGEVTNNTLTTLTNYAGTTIGTTVIPNDAADGLQFTYKGELASLTFNIDVSTGSVKSIDIISGGTGYNNNSAGVVKLPVQIYGANHAEYIASGDSTGSFTSATVTSGGFGYFDPVTEIKPLELIVAAPVSGRQAKVAPYISSDGMLAGAHIIDAGDGYDQQNPPTLTRIGGWAWSEPSQDRQPEVMVADVRIFDGRVVGIAIPDNERNGLKYGTKALISGNGVDAELSLVVETGITDVNILHAGDGEFKQFYLDNTKPTLTITDANRTSPMIDGLSVLQDAVLDIELNSAGNIAKITVLNAGNGYVDPVLTIEGQDEANVVLSAKRNVKQAVVANQGSGYDNATVSVSGDGVSAKVKVNIDTQGGVNKVIPVEYIFNSITANRVYLYAPQFNGATDVDITTSTITSTNHGLLNGTAVRVGFLGNSAITGLSETLTYYVRDVTINTFRLSYTPDLSSLVKIKNIGGAAQYRVSGIGQTLNDCYALKFKQNGGDAIAGLVDGSVYFITHASDDSFSLSTSLENAFNGVVMSLPNTAEPTIYSFESVGYGYSKQPTVTVNDVSGFGAISKVNILSGGGGYTKLPYLSLPQSNSVDVTPRFGGKVIAASKSIGRVKTFGFDNFGYGYDEPPMISLPFAAIMQDSTGFKPGEKIFVDGYPYNNKDIIGYIRDRNPIIVSNVTLDEGIPVTVHTTGPDGKPMEEEVFGTSSFTSAVIYLQTQGFNLVLEQDDENDGEPDNLMFDSITPLNAENWDNLIQEDGSLILTDTGFMLFQDENTTKATTSSLGVSRGYYTKLESSDEPELNGSWEIIDVTDYAFTIKISDRVFGVGDYSGVTFDLDKVEILSYENGPSGIVGYVDSANHTLIINDATDLLVITTEDGLEVIDESETVNVEHEASFEIPSTSLITGTKSGFSSGILRSSRAQGLAKNGGNAFTSFEFKNDVGMLNSSQSLLHNNERIQDFAYVVGCGLTLDQYENVLKKTVHPAGYKMFGKIVGELFSNVPNVKLPLQDKYGSSFGQELILSIVGGLGENTSSDYKTEKYMYANRMSMKNVGMDYLDKQIGLFNKPINEWDFDYFGDHVFDNARESECSITATYTKSGDFVTVNYKNSRSNDWWDKDQTKQDELSSEYTIRRGQNIMMDFGGVHLLRKVYTISENNFVVQLDGADISSSVIGTELMENITQEDGGLLVTEIGSVAETFGVVTFINNPVFDSIASTPISYAIETGKDPEGNEGYWNIANSKIRLYHAYDGAMLYSYTTSSISIQTGTEPASVYGSITMTKEDHGLKVDQYVYVEFETGDMVSYNGFYTVYEVPTPNTVVFFAPTGLSNTSGIIKSIMIDVMNG